MGFLCGILFVTFCFTEAAGGKRLPRTLHSGFHSVMTGDWLDNRSS